MISDAINFISYIPGPNVVIGSAKMFLGLFCETISFIGIQALSYLKGRAEAGDAMPTGISIIAQDGDTLKELQILRANGRASFLDGAITAVPFLKPALKAAQIAKNHFSKGV